MSVLPVCVDDPTSRIALNGFMPFEELTAIVADPRLAAIFCDGLTRGEYAAARTLDCPFGDERPRERTAWLFGFQVARLA